MDYKVTTFDVCVPGMERMKNIDEWIISAPVVIGMSLPDIRQALFDDVRHAPDWIDQQRMREAVDACYQDILDALGPHKAIGNNPFDLEPDHGDEIDECCQVFMFVHCVETLELVEVVEFE